MRGFRGVKGTPLESKRSSTFLGGCGKVQGTEFLFVATILYLLFFLSGADHACPFLVVVWWIGCQRGVAASSPLVGTKYLFFSGADVPQCSHAKRAAAAAEQHHKYMYDDIYVHDCLDLAVTHTHTQAFINLWQANTQPKSLIHLVGWLVGSFVSG
jgi:hypothetical protein